MSQITILGVTGFVGQHLVKKALDSRYSIKALARNPSKLNITSDRLQIVEGDYFDPEHLDRVLEGSIAVVSAIGPPLKQRTTREDADNYINAMMHLLGKLEKNGPSRIINISGAGMKLKEEKLPFPRKFMRFVMGTIAPQVKVVKETEMELLANSKLEWTSVRPPMIAEHVKGSLKTAESAFVGMKVDVEQLVAFLLDELDEKKWVGKAMTIATK